MQKKIIMLIDTFGYGGGAERQFSGLALSLYEKGYIVKCLAYHNDEGYQNEFRKAGLEYMILSCGSSQLSKLKSIRRQLSIERPDVVISYKDAPNCAACLIKALGAKWHLIVSDRNTLQGTTYATKLQYDLLYRFADYIVPNSYAQKNFIDRHFPHLSSKVHVITNFTDTNTFHPACSRRPDIRKKQILVVARIAMQKNVLTFIDAVRMIATKWRDKAHIIWYGTVNVSEEEYGKQCLALIDEYKIADFIEFRKPVYDIDKVYQASDVFCLPSLYEGFPNVLCEAMASGLVVCASDICDNSRIITDGVNGYLFNPYNAQEIADVLAKIISLNPNELSKLKKEARNFAVDSLDVRIFTDKYIKLIQS